MTPLFVEQTAPAPFRVTVRILTADGQSIAQAVDSYLRRAAAERRAIAQACRYARDRGWGRLVFKKSKPAREIR